MDARLIVIIVGPAAVLFVPIQLVPLLDGGGPYSPMPAIDVEDVPIRSATAADNAGVELRVDDCPGQPMIDQVSESDTDVRVRVVAEVDGDSGTCPATVHVQLREPLGERDVIDVFTGRPVEQP